MSIILDKLYFPEDKVYTSLPINYFSIYNIFPVLAILLVLRLFNISNGMILIIAVILFIGISYYNHIEQNKKVLFLNNILFNDNEEPFEIKSYLSYDPKIIDFYYQNKWYIDYNLTAYRKSLESVNNLLQIEYNLTQNLMKYPEQLYQNAYIEYKEALNSLHSSIYKIITQPIQDDIFNDNLKKLKLLLDKHIKNIQNGVIKCGYNLYNINYRSIINPTNLEKANDIKSKEYSPHYSFF